MNELTYNDFAALFSGTEIEIESVFRSLQESYNWRYRNIEPPERDKLIVSICKRIDAPDLPESGANREQDWEQGWGENLNEFIESDFELNKLIPKYFKKNVPVRLNQDYIIPEAPDFTFNMTVVFRAWIFQKYLSNSSNIYEFGCGTGHNLVYAAQCWPDKKLFGFDWAKSSQEIITRLSHRYHWNMEGHHFDFFKPDGDRFEPNSAVLTFGALEQVGPDHRKYVDFILERKPEICLDIAGLHELYDQEDLPDYLALKYHLKRNYLNGYLTYLRQLESDGRIEIISTHKLKFGNLYDDPYSYIVWKPL